MHNNVKWKLAQFLELNWWRFYFKDKSKEKYYSDKMKYLLRILKSLEYTLDDFTGKNILNAGCGPAGFFILLNEAKITAVDPLLNRYEKKIEFFNMSDYPNVKFESISVEDFQPEIKYEFIFCINMLDHVREPEKVIRVFKNVLADEGKVIVLVDTNKYKLLIKLMNVLPLNPLHPQQLTNEEYINLFKRNNLKPLSNFTFKKKLLYDYKAMIFIHQKKE
ncbi:MAG: class I SAM-dependent methyltransferase [Candidatus Cloacimonetes bacterium]|nr:class I SAM-dependent methyltransferase [Candidatus Cloacimonadota bacterium]